MSAEEQAKNAIKWIDEMYGRPKTTHQLAKEVDGKMAYCCLGSGCQSLNIKFSAIAPNSYDLAEMVGLNDTNGELKDLRDSLILLNDGPYAADKTLDNIADYIKNNPENVFKDPETAKLIRQHYAQ